MKLICPSCGAIHSAEAWFNEGEIKASFLIVVSLPKPVCDMVIGYLALFRPRTGRSLQWGKTRRLLTEIRAMISETHIKWDGKPARPCTSVMWGQAMTRMADQPPARLPLTSHNYLRAIVYDLADEADRQAEKRRNEMERRGESCARPGNDRQHSEPEPVTMEFIRNLRKERGI